jgi:hypothetical protein
MALPVLFPLHEQETYLLRNCKLFAHSGLGKIKSHGASSHPMAKALDQWSKAAGKPSPSDHDFDCTFFVPPSGNAVILLRGELDARLSQNFGEGLTLTGTCSDGPFELSCPQYYVRATSEWKDDPAWAIAFPVNEAVRIRYGKERPIRRVHAIINNFDFEHGNVEFGQEKANRRQILRVEASGRLVDFAWRDGHDELALSVRAEIFNTTALTTFSFDAWDGASREDLANFAHNIASLCGIVARQHTGTPVITFVDAEDRPIERLVGNPVESSCRPKHVIRFLHFDEGLPKLFRECFDEHVRMRACDLWDRLPFLCAAIEDSPYLEQKFATLMTAIELLIRSTLIEGGHMSEERANGLKLQSLVGEAKQKLGWDIPKHYTAKDRHSKWRNAVAHGNRLPEAARKFRHYLEKWHLFLLRRLLMRLGYSGDVASPQGGMASSSPVNDFTEEHNSFGP